MPGGKCLKRPIQVCSMSCGSATPWARATAVASATSAVATSTTLGSV
jgi:hypothetical protein